MPFALLLVLSTLQSFPEGQMACSCQELIPVEQAYTQSEAVFSGRVDRLRWDGGDHIRVRLRVTRTWKGAVGPAQSVWVSAPAHHGVGCPVVWEPRYEYL